MTPSEGCLHTWDDEPDHSGFIECGECGEQRLYIKKERTVRTEQKLGRNLVEGAPNSCYRVHSTSN